MALFQAVKRTCFPMIALLVCMVQNGLAKTPVGNKAVFIVKYMDVAAYFYVVAVLPVSTRETGRTLYQATESITFEPGFESEDGAEFVAEIITQEVQPPSNNIVAANGDMNWVIARSFDARGKVLSEQKQFYDSKGQLLQSQNKIRYRKSASAVYTHTFARQSVQDMLGRNALSTLSAPIDNSDFNYRPDFIRNSSGGVYDYRNFDRFGPVNAETDKTYNPDPVGGQNVQGTLGWYYSNNNTWEPYTATTSYPYNRQSFYRDGTGNVKMSGDIGESFKMGSGHEVASYETPVVSELDHYMQVRNRFFPASEVGATPTTLQSEAVQYISRDANNRLSVVIVDKSGNALMAGRPGSDLTITNTSTIAAGNVFYFRVFATGNISISSANNQLYNMESQTEELVNIGTGGSIAAGYYKLVNTGTANITITYNNSYSDVSYNIYNQLGKLIATIAPEGVKKLYGAGLNNYATKNDIPFIRLHEYDVRGRLIKTKSPDGGISEVVYRRDGKMRFSQNAQQRTTGRFTYTNYDAIGRPIECGEYQPDASGITFTGDMSVSSAMKSIVENTSTTGGLTTGTKTDVTVIKYDASETFCCFTQNEINLRGKISVTRKFSSIVNNVINWSKEVCKTLYNYDEEGRIIGLAQGIQGLDPKWTEFSYDATGRLIKKVFRGSTGAETFVHYYDYDQETGRLWKVYTNTEDNLATRQLQATYIYYLHGPLKRVELATNLQGIDYSYTLDGSLKAINNSDKTKDPGGDGSNGIGADAYGMVLDYHAGDYVNERGGIQPIRGVNTNGIATDSYTGQIKAMTWYSRKPASMSGISGVEDPTTYVYKYDDKYQFTESTWGTGINFGNTPATFTATGFNKETIKHPTTGAPAYDANGNIQYLQRTDGTGAMKDKFSYTYELNTNRLQTVMHDNNGTPQLYAGYTYDELGQLKAENTGDPSKKKYVKYNVSGQVIAVARDDQFQQLVVEYDYNELGQRIIKKLYNSSYQLAQITYYVGHVIYTRAAVNGTPVSEVIPQEYAIDGGSSRLGVYYRPMNIYAYELADHLGNVRAVIAKSSATYEVRMYTDYYPYGMEIQKAGTNDYRYGYQGQYSEKDGATDWNAFELRMYDSRIARWLSVDPYNEFWSPYSAMGNNPANLTDKRGGCVLCRVSDFVKKFGDRVGTISSKGWKKNSTYYVMYIGDDEKNVIKVFRPNFLEKIASLVTTNALPGNPADAFDMMGEVWNATELSFKAEKKVGTFGLGIQVGDVRYKVEGSVLKSSIDKDFKIGYSFFDVTVGSKLGPYGTLEIGASMDEGVLGREYKLFNGDLSWKVGTSEKYQWSGGGSLMVIDDKGKGVHPLVANPISMKHNISDKTDIQLLGEETKFKLNTKLGYFKAGASLDYGTLIDHFTSDLFYLR